MNPRGKELERFKDAPPQQMYSRKMDRGSKHPCTIQSIDY